MNYCINASNLKNGGGLQVADSICRQLHRFQGHFFFVVLSSQLAATQQAMEGVGNVKCVTYDLKDDWRSLLLGRWDETGSWTGWWRRTMSMLC